MAEILEARETKLVELSRSNLELQEKNTDLTSQVREAKKINSKLNEANISSEEFTQRLSTMEKKLQQTIAERDKFKEESKILKIELVSKLPDSDIAEKDEIISDLRAESNYTFNLPLKRIHKLCYRERPLERPLGTEHFTWNRDLPMEDYFSRYRFFSTIGIGCRF